MSEITPFILRHIFVSGLGVGVLALLALSLRVLVSRDAVLRYRVMVGALLAGVALLPLQFAVAESAGSTAPPVLSPRAASVPSASPAPSSQAAPAALNPPDRIAAVPAQTLASPTWPTPALLLGAYVIGASVVLVSRLRGALAAHRLIARARPVTDPRVLAMWSPLIGAMKSPPLLLECGALRTPACRVLGRAAVILPSPTASLDEDSLCAALRHELVHITRHDGIVVLLTAAAEIVFWFQPLVWVFARVLCADREQSCDALVVRTTGRARSYARALLRFCEPDASRRAPAPLIGFESSHPLRRRIMMLTHALQPADRSRRLALLAAGLASLTATFASHGFITTVVGPGSLLSKEDTGAKARASVEVRAAVDGRSELNVYERVMQLQRAKEQAGGTGGLVLAQPSPEANLLALLSGTTPRVEYPAGTWVADDEPIVTAKSARLEDDVLRSRTLRLRLPGGSKLRASFEGSTVKVEAGENQSDRVLVTGGTVSIVDETGVTRARIRAEDEGATLVWTSVAGAEPGTFELSTSDGTSDLAARIDTTTGVAEHEQQPPHGSVRWMLVAPLSGEGLIDLRMQWNYDVSQVKNPVGC